MDFSQLASRLESLSVFRALLQDEVIASLRKVIDPKQSDSFRINYCEMVYALYQEHHNLSAYVLHKVDHTYNIAIEFALQGKSLPQPIQGAMDYDLQTIQMLMNLTSTQCRNIQDITSFLPTWENTVYDVSAWYDQKLKDLPKNGFGIYASNFIFTLRNQKIVPNEYPDKQPLYDLIGYQEEREALRDNTLAFLQGIKASNALLYGDAGTGKSSTIKAMVNEYAHLGLRLIEVGKSQLFYLPELLDVLAKNPLKFILFIDDLSFSDNDDNFIALKTILEGGVAAGKGNVLVYATSNRRHFVKESMSHRNSDELFTNDSIQETMSLAARFGLTITFQKPFKDLYLDIVEGLANQHGLLMDTKTLHAKAERFAIRGNGRSPRTAKQFVEYECMMQHLNLKKA